MYKIGELVVYSNEGVCKIEEISELNIPGVNKSKKYYILAPMHGNGKVFVPIDTKAFMRAIITYEEIQNSISKVSLIDNFEHDMKNARALEDHYKKLLKSYECIDLLNIMASIDNKKNNLMKNGKKLNQIDEKFMKIAKNLLDEEFSMVLGIPKEEVERYIQNKIN